LHSDGFLGRAPGGAPPGGSGHHLCNRQAVRRRTRRLKAGARREAARAVRPRRDRLIVSTSPDPDDLPSGEIGAPATLPPEIGPAAPSRIGAPSTRGHAYSAYLRIRWPVSGEVGPMSHTSMISISEAVDLSCT